MARSAAIAPTPTVPVTGQQVASAPLPPCASAALHPANIPAGKPAATPPTYSRTAEPRHGAPPRDPPNSRTADRPNPRTEASPAPAASHERLRALLGCFHRWVYAVLLGGLVPPLTIFLIVAGGIRRRASWYVPRCWRAGLQRPDEICLAGEALKEPFTALLAVLHAILEQAATLALAEPRAPGARRRYRRVKALAETIGLSLHRSRGGRWLSPSCSPTLHQRILLEFVPNFEVFTAVRNAPPAPRRPNSPRWRCACQKPTWRMIRRVHFRARCQACGTLFVQQDPWPPPPGKAYDPATLPAGKRTTVRLYDRSPEKAGNRRQASLAPPPRPIPEGNGEPPWDSVTSRTVEPSNGRTLCSAVPAALGVESPASGGEPGVSLEPVYAEFRRLVAYARTKRFQPPHTLQPTPQLVVQPQGRRKTPTWFTPAAWHGDGPARPEIGSPRKPSPRRGWCTPGFSMNSPISGCGSRTRMRRCVAITTPPSGIPPNGSA